MHGLINRSFESFLRHRYGAGLWALVALELNAGIETFEPMLRYDDALTQRMISIAVQRLDRPRPLLLEDFGAYLVDNPASGRVRRLLRFGGVDYEDFLFSLEDLRGRARLAVPDLDLPELKLYDRGCGHFSLDVRSAHMGFGHVFLGLLRALADDYGTPVLLGYDGRGAGAEHLSVRLLAADLSTGRGADPVRCAAG